MWVWSLNAVRLGTLNINTADVFTHEISRLDDRLPRANYLCSQRRALHACESVHMWYRWATTRHMGKSTRQSASWHIRFWGIVEKMPDPSVRSEFDGSAGCFNKCIKVACRSKKETMTFVLSLTDSSKVWILKMEFRWKCNDSVVTKGIMFLKRRWQEMTQSLRLRCRGLGTAWLSADTRLDRG